MIDLTSETTLSLKDAAKKLPRGRNGAKPHVSTLIRWIEDGAVAPNSERVYLEGLRLGGKWVTSLEAIQRFAEALTPQNVQPAKAKTKRQRKTCADIAGGKLSEIGI